MNKFVNYGTRSISLPGGCQDLIDVLRLEASSSAPQASELGSLADVETYIGRQLRAAANFSNLLIQWAHPLDHIQVVLIEGELNVVAMVEAKSTREPAVRAFFARANLLSGGGEPLKTLTAQTEVLRYQLPGTCRAAAAVICHLLCKGYGLSAAARLELLYVEGQPA